MNSLSLSFSFGFSAFFTPFVPFFQFINHNFFKKKNLSMFYYLWCLLVWKSIKNRLRFYFQHQHTCVNLQKKVIWIQFIQKEILKWVLIKLFCAWVYYYYLMLGMMLYPYYAKFKLQHTYIPKLHIYTDYSNLHYLQSLPLEFNSHKK